MKELLTGFEPEYAPSKWNENPKIKMYNNCYAYLLDKREDRKGKPQPGRYSGKRGKMEYTCEDTYKRMTLDNPWIYKTKEDGKCARGFYKGYLAVDPGRDYHYYRQDSIGYWSHKPGKDSVMNVDASGNKIINPRVSDRKFSNYDYKESCGYFCVPAGKGNAKE